MRTEISFANRAVFISQRRNNINFQAARKILDKRYAVIARRKLLSQQVFIELSIRHRILANSNRTVFLVYSISSEYKLITGLTFNVFDIASAKILSCKFDKRHA